MNKTIFITMLLVLSSCALPRRVDYTVTCEEVECFEDDARWATSSDGQEQRVCQWDNLTYQGEEVSRVETYFSRPLAGGCWVLDETKVQY